MENTRKIKSKLLRQKAEGLLKLHASKSGDLLITESDSPYPIFELEVHKIELELQKEELELQNEQLILAIQQEKIAKAKYNTLFEFAPSAYFTLTSNGDIIESNLMGAKMIGKNPQNLFNNRLALFITIDSRSIFDDFLSRILIGNSQQSCEVAFNAIDGIPLHVQLSGTLANDGSHCLITAVDNTDAKNLELLHGKEKDFELNSLLLSLFVNAPILTDEELYNQALDIAVKITDSKIGFFHQVSHDQQEIILTTWNEEAKKNCTTVYDNHYPINQAGNWADAIREKKVVVYNDFSASPNKKGLPAGHAPIGRTLSVPVLLEDKVMLIFGVGNKSTNYSDIDSLRMQDVADELFKILEKRKVEVALQKIEERWRFAIEGSNEGIWDWNAITDEVFYSNRWKEIIGYKPEELEATLSEWQNRVHPDDLEMVMQQLQYHLERPSSVYSTDHRILCKDGSWKWILDRGKVMEWSADGKPVRMVGTHSDITERKRTDELLKESEKKLQELNATKDKFFSIIAHDLRSPFNSIIGFCNLLLEQIKNKDIENIELYAQIILQSSNKAMELLMNLMEWSRLQIGRMELNPVNFDMTTLLSETSDLFNKIAEQKSITIKNSLPHHLSVFADKAMISTIVRNLISNAVKFTMSGGEVYITALENQNEIIISVRDTGIGISPESIGKLFRIDQVYSTTGTNKEYGTGLGLILCKEFVEMHKGKIWVESKVAEGSTFYFTLPLCPILQ